MSNDSPALTPEAITELRDFLAHSAPRFRMTVDALVLLEEKANAYDNIAIGCGVDRSNVKRAVYVACMGVADCARLERENAALRAVATAAEVAAALTPDFGFSMIELRESLDAWKAAAHGA